MDTNVPEGHTASILRDEMSKSEKVAGDTKGRRKEMGNGGITTINHKEEEGPKQAHGNSGTCKWQLIQEIRTQPFNRYIIGDPSNTKVFTTVYEQPQTNVI